jgi:hypothetical protein
VRGLLAYLSRHIIWRFVLDRLFEEAEINLPTIRSLVVTLEIHRCLLVLQIEVHHTRQYLIAYVTPPSPA